MEDLPTPSADGDVAKQITDLLAKNAKASVTGAATGDTIKVTAVKKKPRRSPSKLTGAYRSK